MAVSELEELQMWNNQDCIRFAVWCAKRVAHFNPDHRVAEAIAAAERWLELPSKRNVLAASAAAAAVYAYAADHAPKAANAAHAAAFGAAYSATYASGAAYAAATCAAHASELAKTQLLDLYLSEQLMLAVNC